MIQAKELKNSAVLRTLTDLQPEIHNETRWSGKCKMLQKWIRIRSELIEASSHPNSNIEINDSLAYKNRVNKFTKWMKEADVITIYMQTEYITLGECRSALDLFTKTVETKKNHIGHPLYECPFKQEKSKWNSCLAPDKHFESGVAKIQQRSAVDLTVIGKKLVESY